MVEGGHQTFDPSDPRSLVAQADDERQRQKWMAQKREELLKTAGDVVKAAQDEELSSTDLVKYVAMILGSITILVVAVAYGLIWYLDNYGPK